MEIVIIKTLINALKRQFLITTIKFFVKTKLGYDVVFHQTNNEIFCGIFLAVFNIMCQLQLMIQ